MSSLAYYSPNLVGFFSYSRDDDRGSRGALSALRDAIQWELSGQLGRSEKNFRIWQDKAAIPVGADWEDAIRRGVSQSAFFIPIITPRVFKSENCAFEFESFLARERELGRADLVFPLLYIPVPELQDEKIWRKDPVLKVVGTRQYFDWQNLRFAAVGSPEVGEQVARFCQNITNAMRKPWESPEERQEREENEALRIAEQEQRRTTAKIAAQRAFDEDRQRHADAAARLADEAKSREKAEAEAREREEALAAQRAEKERAFVAAKRANTVAAFDGFLDAHAGGDFAGEAQKLREALLARQDAHGRAMASDDVAVLRAFCKTYQNGADVDEVRVRLRLRTLAPVPDWKSPRPALAMAATLAAVLFIGVLVWAVHKPTPEIEQASVAPAQPAAPAKTAMVQTVQPPPSIPAAAPATPALTPSVTALPNATPAGSAVPLPPSLTPAPPPAAAPTPAKIVSATGPDLTKWAFCQPNSTQKAEAMGGVFQPAPIKLALTKAQQDVMAVRTIAISPDGKILVTAGDDTIIRVWDAATLKWIREIPGHSLAVYSVAFSSDGNLLASASFDGTVQIWNAHTFAHVHTFDTAPDGSGLAKVKQYGVAFQPVSNPQYVDSAGADGNVWIWDLRKQALARKAQSHTGNGDPTVGSLSFAPNGSGTFATANFDGTITFFDPSRTDPVNAFPSKALRLAYSPDGTLVASAGADASGKSMGIKLWNSATHALFKAIPAHKGHAASVAWSRDGTRLASGGGFADATAALWDVRSAIQTPSQTFKPQNKNAENKDVEAVAFHPNQRWLISGSEDGTMRIWDIASGKELLTVVGVPGGGEYVAYAPNGCYTGSANAANYVKYVTKDGDQSSTTMLVPGDSTQLLLPQ